ncbi:hypothetical protein PRIPAC_73015 [Pristionchus pacificus]|uniref:Uncharacterized protein n=1 Tax=Pristionchus pacificus TaxID=54126 RepID=A0A2A6C5W1_PRIPA|nr:hypothetical protein PRIPAC_73015 [Pristionchus pacificus]|eukprot:PDM73478.1 hypothetical protein PRIPAC_40834 [Pristionchus pacificus]
MRLLVLLLVVFCAGEAGQNSNNTPRWFECGGTRESEDIAWFFIWNGCRGSLLKINRCCKQHDACYLRGKEYTELHPNETWQQRWEGFTFCNQRFDSCLLDVASLNPLANSPLDHICNAIYAGMSAVAWLFAPTA